MSQKELNPVTTRNYFYAMIALTILLYLLGGLGVLAVYSNDVITYARENIPFYIELRDSSNDAEIFRFQKELESSKYIKYGSVRYISKEDAMAELTTDKELQLTKDDIMLFGENLLPNAITFNLKSEHLGAYNALLNDIKSRKVVADVYHIEGIARQSSVNLGRLGFITILLVLCFVFVAITLINNTLKLSFFSSRDYILIMQLSGATEDYLAQPYLRNSVRNAIICSGIAILLLIFTIVVVQLQPNSSVDFGNWGGYSFVFLGLILTGIVTFWASTKYSIRKYITKGFDKAVW